MAIHRLHVFGELLESLVGAQPTLHELHHFRRGGAEGVSLGALFERFEQRLEFFRRTGGAHRLGEALEPFGSGERVRIHGFGQPGKRRGDLFARLLEGSFLHRGGQRRLEGIHILGRLLGEPQLAGAELRQDLLRRTGVHASVRGVLENLRSAKRISRFRIAAKAAGEGSREPRPQRFRNQWPLREREDHREGGQRGGGPNARPGNPEGQQIRRVELVGSRAGAADLMDFPGRR